MRVILGLLIGALGGAIVTGVLLALFSGNTHDKSVEIAMTSTFVGVPVGGVIGAIVGAFTRRGR